MFSFAVHYLARQLFCTKNKTVSYFFSIERILNSYRRGKNAVFLSYVKMKISVVQKSVITRTQNYIKGNPIFPFSWETCHILVSPTLLSFRKPILLIGKYDKIGFRSDPATLGPKKQKCHILGPRLSLSPV